MARQPGTPILTDKDLKDGSLLLETSRGQRVMPTPEVPKLVPEEAAVNFIQNFSVGVGDPHQHIFTYTIGRPPATEFFIESFSSFEAFQAGGPQSPEIDRPTNIIFEPTHPIQEVGTHAARVTFTVEHFNSKLFIKVGVK